MHRRLSEIMRIQIGLIRVMLKVLGLPFISLHDQFSRILIQTLFSGTNVPHTSYVKVNNKEKTILSLIITIVFQAIDIWMGTCTAFVFAALVEFTFVNYTWR